MHWQTKLIIQVIFITGLDTISSNLPLLTPTAAQIAEKDIIKQRILEKRSGTNPTQDELNNANTQYTAYNIETDGDIIRERI